MRVEVRYKGVIMREFLFDDVAQAYIDKKNEKTGE